MCVSLTVVERVSAAPWHSVCLTDGLRSHLINFYPPPRLNRLQELTPPLTSALCGDMESTHLGDRIQLFFTPPCCAELYLYLASISVQRVNNKGTGWFVPSVAGECRLRCGSTLRCGERVKGAWRVPRVGAVPVGAGQLLSSCGGAAPRGGWRGSKQPHLHPVLKIFTFLFRIFPLGKKKTFSSGTRTLSESGLRAGAGLVYVRCTGERGERGGRGSVSAVCRL